MPAANRVRGNGAAELQDAVSGVRYPEGEVEASAIGTGSIGARSHTFGMRSWLAARRHPHVTFFIAVALV